MPYKILVADDSLTIQKVVGITLSDTGYEIHQTLSDEKLLSLLESENYDLLLLDFNLSESKSGLELIKELREKAQDLPILIMLGTFDSIEDLNLLNYGIIDKIVKPFESIKFLDLCEDLLSRPNSTESDFHKKNEKMENSLEFNKGDFPSIDDESPTNPSIQFQANEDVTLSGEDMDSGWEVNAPEKPEEGGFQIESEDLFPGDSKGIEGPAEYADSLSSEGEDLLKSEIQGWGMAMPSVIGGLESEFVFPPVIEKNLSGSEAQLKIEEVIEEKAEGSTNGDEGEGEFGSINLENNDELEARINGNEEISLPPEDDLSYPDHFLADGPTSSLVSTDELTPDDDKEGERLEVTNPQAGRPQTGQELAKQIEEEVTAEEFWATDDLKDVVNDKGRSLGDSDLTGEFKIDDYVSGAGAVADLENFQRQEKQSLDKKSQPEKAIEVEIDNNEIVEKIKEALMPAIEEMIREVCREKIEQIAWEVIPDLAQNFIAKEIKEISDSVKE